MANKSIGRAALAAVLFEIVAILPALADMQVLESNVPEFNVGSRMSDANELKLPPGGRVKVLVLPSNETKIFTGPNASQPNLRDVPFGATRGAPPATPRN